MKPATGRWVRGDDFFGRESELQILKNLASEYNHVLLTGQRRMGKTSIVQELGRRLESLESKEWVFVFADVEGAECPEDVVARIAKAARPVLSRSSQFIIGAKDWIGEDVEIGAPNFRMKIHAGLNAGNWQHHGEQLIRDCAKHEKSVLLVIDEVPIFLNRMRYKDDNAERVDLFMSWFRGVLQTLGGHSLAVILSGSIGLEPLMQRLGLSDRINHLDSFPLGPWSRDDSIKCFKRLAESNDLQVDEGVAAAVYKKLGIGIPQHVQSFFACLRGFSIMKDRDRVTVEDVNEVYNAELLGPAGQRFLMHYETRLEDALDDDSYTIAMEILAEAAVQGVFTLSARCFLERAYSKRFPNVSGLISDVLDVLIHDGYLEKAEDHSYFFPSRLLKDWWSMRFPNHKPLEHRFSDDERESS